MKKPTSKQTPAQKFKIVSDLWDEAVKTKSRQIREQFPELNEKEVLKRVVELIEKEIG